MTPTLAALLHRLRRLGPPDPESDAALLERFARHRDQGAFAALVARHGGMVLHLCRRILGDDHAAEDCLQATFLVLARKAGSLGQPAALAGWLHAVARRVALKARGRDRRRSSGALAEGFEPADPRPDPLAELSARDLLRVVEEEVGRLPEAYRLPVALCCLEGLTLEEAARRLAASPGSVRARLERGRKRLRDRLASRGLALPAALAAVELSRTTAGAEVAAALRDQVVATMSAAAQREAGAASSHVRALAEGVCRAMAIKRVKQMAVAMMLLGILGAGGGALAYQFRVAEGTPAREQRDQPPGGGAAPVAQAKPAGPSAPDRAETERATAHPAEQQPGKGRPGLRKLPREILQKRAEAARKVFTQNLARLRGAQGFPSELFGWSERWLEAELALSDKEAERVKALRDHLDRARAVEQLTAGLARAGQGRQADADAATYYRLEAEIRLLREGVEPHPAKGRQR